MTRHHSPSTKHYTSLDAPESIAVVFTEAWNRRDPDTLASLFDHDAEFVNVVGLWWHNQASIRKAHAYGLKHIFSRSTLRLLENRVKYLSDTIAVVHARMSLTGQSAVGTITNLRPRQNIFSFVVRKTPGGWRCASAHNTDIVPHRETNVIDDMGRVVAVGYRDR